MNRACLLYLVLVTVPFERFQEKEKHPHEPVKIAAAADRISVQETYIRESLLIMKCQSAKEKSDFFCAFLSMGAFSSSGVIVTSTPG